MEEEREKGWQKERRREGRRKGEGKEFSNGND